MAMKSAFCCASLRTGTFVVGWVLMVWVIWTGFDIISFYMEYRPSMVPQNGTLNDTGSYNYTYLILTSNDAGSNHDTSNITWLPEAILEVLEQAVFFLALLCLLYGTYKDRRGFIIPFLIFSLMEVALWTKYAIEIIRYMVESHVVTLWPKTLLRVILTPIVFIYFLCIVGSHFVQLNPKNRQDCTNKATFVNKPAKEES